MNETDVNQSETATNKLQDLRVQRVRLIINMLEVVDTSRALRLQGKSDWARMCDAEIESFIDDIDELLIKIQKIKMGEQ